MALGIYLRELWRHRLGLIIVVALSLLVAIWSVERISLLPPKLTPRSLEMGTASARILVDTPKSTAVNASSSANALVALTQRASLLGSIIASGPVRQFIASRAHVLPEQIVAEGPVTPDVPRALPEPGHEPSTTDILKSTDEYRLDVEVQPTAPIIDIYVQAPSAEKASKLADASFEGLRDYLATVAREQQIEPSAQVKLLKLGPSPGSVVNKSVHLELMLVALFVSFAAFSAALLFIARVRKGWRSASGERPDAASRRPDDDTPLSEPALERIS